MLLLHESMVFHEYFGELLHYMEASGKLHFLSRKESGVTKVKGNEESKGQIYIKQTIPTIHCVD